MKLTNIHDTWGTLIEISIEEFFEQDFDYWRNLIYDRKILIFREMQFTKSQYCEFSLRFGRPWQSQEYKYSNEASEIVDVKNFQICVSPFSNASKKLGNSEMPWHSDIPNKRENPFPIRSLWITSNPYPSISGKTSWMNLEESLDYLTKDQKELLDKVKVVQQSWYEPGTDIQEFPLIKTNPITGKKSLRLNYFNELDKNKQDAWITGVKVDGVLQKDCKIISEFLTHLEKINDLVYTHTWKTFDIAIYDNWSFVHKRTQVIPGPTGVRHFYRMNIDHLQHTRWEDHKQRYL